MEMTISSLSVSREQANTVPSRVPGADGTLNAGSDLDLVPRTTESNGDFASVFSLLFPTSSSEEVEKNGDQQESSDRGHPDHSNTSQPHSKEETLASLLTVAPTPSASSLLLSSLVHSGEHSTLPDSPQVPLVPSGQATIDHPDNAASSQYAGEGSRRSHNSGQEYKPSAIVALGVPLKASGHRARPNGREAEILSAPFGEQHERGIFVPESQDEDVRPALAAFPLDQTSLVPSLQEQVVQEKHPGVADVSSLSVSAPLSIPPVISGVVAPGGANAEEHPRAGDDAFSAHAPSVRIVSPGPRLSEPENAEPIQVQPSYEQDRGGSSAVAPGSTREQLVHREPQGKAQLNTALVTTVPSSPTNEGTQQDLAHLSSSSSSSEHLLEAAGTPPPERAAVAKLRLELPPTEDDSSGFGQFHGPTTSGERNGQGQPTQTFIRQHHDDPIVTYTSGYAAEHNPSSAGEESLRFLTNTHNADIEEFAVRRTRRQERVTPQATGLDSVRPQGDGFGVATPPPTFAQLHAAAGPVVIERVAREIAAHIGQGKGKAVIELEPQELGRIQIDLVLDGEKVRVRIVTEAAEASSLIQTHLLELKQALQHHSLELSTVSVDVNAGGGERADLPYGSQQQLGRHNDNGTGDPGSQTDENDPDPRKRNDPAQPRSGVSVWA